MNIKTKLLQELTVKLLEQNNISIESGETYSIKCQYAQIENIVSSVIDEMTEHALGNMQASYDSDMFNASGDGSQPLIDLEAARCAIEDFIS